jgi:hypothetical protein
MREGAYSIFMHGRGKTFVWASVFLARDEILDEIIRPAASIPILLG